MILIDSIKDIKINQFDFINLMKETELLKIQLLHKLKTEDENVKKFVESKLYFVLKSNVINKKDKYNYYLKAFEGDYSLAITPEVFKILMEEGPYEKD